MLVHRPGSQAAYGKLAYRGDRPARSTFVDTMFALNMHSTLSKGKTSGAEIETLRDEKQLSFASYV